MPTTVRAKAAIGIALAILVAVYLWQLANAYWLRDESSQGWLVALLVAWLVNGKRREILRLTSGTAVSHSPLLYLPLLLCGGMYTIGRSQSIVFLEGLALWLMTIWLVYACGGLSLLKTLLPELIFALLVVPMPAAIVQSVTAPLKAAVSTVAAEAMHGAGYPVARAGVMLYIGQYQLMVADACSGLNSIFTLEALGLIYLRMRGYTAGVRTALLALAVLPISFAANVIRVLILILVTFHLGDEAGQGFLHQFAGMSLFLVGLGMMLLADKLIERFTRNMRQNDVSETNPQ